MKKYIDVSYDVIMIDPEDNSYLDYINGEFDSEKAAKLRAESFNIEYEEDIKNNESGKAIIRKVTREYFI